MTTHNIPHLSEVHRQIIEVYFDTNKGIKDTFNMVVKGGNTVMIIAIISTISAGTGLSESFVKNNLTLILQ